MARVGVIANPAAGRDVRRLAGSAVVTDNYAKRKVAAAVIEGLTMVEESVEAVVMPDRAGIGAHAVDHAPADQSCRLLDLAAEGSAADTRRAADRLRREADVVVVLGGDGTTRDVATTVGDVPVAAVSTGTNNVAPSFVDGAVAGAAAAVVATGGVPAADVCVDHGMVAATVDEPDRERTIRGLVTLGVVDRPFVGTRAVLHGDEFVGGVVSRAAPDDSGLSGVVGALRVHPPTAPGGLAIRLGPPAETARRVRALTLPGVVEEVGVEACTRLDDDETVEFAVDGGVVSVDGERTLEVSDAVVRARPVADGPRLVSMAETLAAATDRDLFVAP
jgi:hypothetical protein